MSKIVIVGAGITGATAAYQLEQLGHDVTVYEAEAEVGGNLRTAKLNGVPYEPHGPHIFHTADEEVWKLVSSLVHLNGYRHRVKTEIPDGSSRRLTWPLQVGELKELPEWSKIAAELLERPGPVNVMKSFEAYAVALMGPTLYGWFCEGYTWKQWGMDPKLLSASFAPRRLNLRTDGDPDMFRDPHQGYLSRGWQVLVHRLLHRIEVRLCTPVYHGNLPDADGYVITAALDDFLGLDGLPWRGVRSIPTWHPRGSTVKLGAPVVNFSDRTVPWTRTVDTRYMAWPEIRDDDDLANLAQVIVSEYPGAPVRHYPVDDVAGENRRVHAEMHANLLAQLPNAVIAGRLGTYTYVDMDQAMRQGMNAARRLHKMLTEKE